ncbi:hypothetical protein [Zooshikella harenae]|uniref:DUF4845 domain-containing protein n=1 Tax=Zooshikella harenae TaxID=2827238 RepID=A0ABS5ZJF9_9GAMM|nr:hypothetical protein [Zooshikella harenae]MBU2714085.1 hypothetical protein [Zooshikella harenae]
MKVFVGFLIGIVASSSIFIPFLISQQKAKYEFGLNAGIVHGMQEATNKIEKKFGEIDSQADYETLYSVKATSVVVVEVNGVKTVRVIN